MKNRTEKVSASKKGTLNYFNLDTYIYETYSSPVWDLRFVYIRLILEIYEE